MRFVLMSAVALVAAAPVHAQGDAFKACDGIKPPGKRGDSLTQIDEMFKSTWTIGEERAAIMPSQEGVTACDAALADPLLLTQFWRRRAYLQQAKAIHLIGLERYDEALRALDASDSEGAGRKDAFFDGSMGAGNHALRGWIYFRQGKTDAALVELEGVARDRPYSPRMAALASAIRLTFQKELGQDLATLAAGAAQSPDLLRRLFWLSMLYGDFPAVLKYGPQLSFELPHGKRTDEIVGFEDKLYKMIAERADVSGAIAYATAASGNIDAANALLARAQADLDEAMAPPIVPEGGKLSRDQKDDFAERKMSGLDGRAKLDRWKAAIGLRGDLAKMNGEELSARAQALSLMDMPVMIDMLTQFGALHPAERGLADMVGAKLRTRLDAERGQAHAMSFQNLVDLLPRIETAAMRPRFKDTTVEQFLLTDNTGFNTTREKDSPYVTVRFASEIATPATVEELALLASAMRARQSGKDSFLIDSRILIKRSIRYGGYSRGSYALPNGWEARIRILPVNAAELPRELEASRWRLQKVSDVADGLYVKYTTKYD